MKIIHITAAYKPAYIYGGPTMSVAKLCEALQGVSGLGFRGLEIESVSCGGVEENENNVESASRLGVENGLLIGGGVEAFNDIDIEVFTTMANGKAELKVEPNKKYLIDNVPVTYFKRLTKDHTHFSPSLLLGLRKEIIRRKEIDKPMLIHIHAWWNLVSILSCWLAKWYNVPVVLSPRGMLTAYTLGNRNVGFKSIIHNFIGKKLLKYCHIHVTSEKEEEDILKFIKPKSITVIANLVELGSVFREASSVYRFSSTVFRLPFVEQQATNKEQRITDNEKRSTKNEQQITNNEQSPSSTVFRLSTNEQQAKSFVFRLPSLVCSTTNNEQRIRIKEQRTTDNEQGSTKNEQRSTNSEQHFPFKLIFLSRIEEKKGLELLFEALAKFNINWSLTIAGSGQKSYVDGLVVRVEGLGISNRINWVGQVKNEDKFKLLAEHDLMVLTSYNENFANVVIESLSVGTPVLLSNEVGLANYIMDKNLGWVSSLDVESIREKLNQAYLNVHSREKIRAEAPKLIATDFNDAVLVKKYSNLYKQIVNGRL